jgi:hypothetical protein
VNSWQDLWFWFTSRRT